MWRSSDCPSPLLLAQNSELRVGVSWQADELNFKIVCKLEAISRAVGLPGL